jgi:hypothetical protein
MGGERICVAALTALLASGPAAAVTDKKFSELREQLKQLKAEYEKRINVPRSGWWSPTTPRGSRAARGGRWRSWASSPPSPSGAPGPGMGTSADHLSAREDARTLLAANAPHLRLGVCPCFRPVVEG